MANLSPEKRSSLKPPPKNSPLSAPEEGYFAAFKISQMDPSGVSDSQIQQLNHFFTTILETEETKWKYILETYFIFPLLKSKDLCQVLLNTRHRKKGFWQKWLCLLMTTRATRRQSLTSNPGVPTAPLLNPAVPAAPHLDSESDSGRVKMGSETEKNLLALYMSAFVTLHFHHFQFINEPGQMKDLLLTSLDTLDEHSGWDEQVAMVGRLMLYAFVNKIVSNAKSFNSTYTSCCWDNLFETLEVLEEFIFYRPARPPGVVKAKEKEIALHLDAQGCLDLPIMSKIVRILGQDLNIHNLDQVLDSDKHAAKLQAKIKTRGMTELEFFTGLTDFFKNLLSDKPDDVEKTITNLITLMSKRTIHTHIPKKKIKDSLNAAVEVIQFHKKKDQMANAAKIAKAMYYGMEEKNKSWRQSLQTLTMHLTNLSGASDDELSTLEKQKETKKVQKEENIKNLLPSLLKAKQRKKYYIHSDVWAKADTVGIDFYVPNLDSNSETKLQVDPPLNTIAVEFDISNQRHGKDSDDVKYVQRETFSGRLKKYVKLPGNIDFTKNPSSVMRPNCLTLIFTILAQGQKQIISAPKNLIPTT